MFSLDDRTGNAVTTVALFMVAATILYIARGAFFILLLSLLFAYLLEPAVTVVQRHSLLGRKNRSWAIAQLYLIGTFVFGCLAYEFGPHLAAQMRSLNAAMPKILQGLSSHREFISRVWDRGASSVADLVASALWLFAVPVLAIYFLQDGRQMANAFIETLESRRDLSLVKRILRRVDAMLAGYIRAQLALAGLSFLFYTFSMLVLRFPYAVALGLLGGALEFLPAVGWILSAATILTIGFLAHAHWIWMAALVLVWRLVQSYVNSPRIMGDNLDLQPLTIVVALMVGSQVGGMSGLYLSVPVVAVLRIVWLECFSNPDSSAVSSDQPLIQLKA